MKMKMKMKLPFRSSSSSWAWPSCHQPRTLSFRANTHFCSSLHRVSAYLEAESSETDDDFGGETIETAIRDLQSDRRRLFFEPDRTSSILEAKAASGGDLELVPFRDSVMVSMESRDPYVDYRKSMEEMVEAHALKHCEGLQKLLCWYLRVNARTNHPYIVAAFVDLLVGLAFAPDSSSSSNSHSPSSPLSFSTSSMSSFSTTCLEADHQEVDNTPTSSSPLQVVKEDISQ